MKAGTEGRGLRQQRSSVLPWWYPSSGLQARQDYGDATLRQSGPGRELQLRLLSSHPQQNGSPRRRTGALRCLLKRRDGAKPSRAVLHLAELCCT